MAESIKESSQLWQQLDSFHSLSHHPPATFSKRRESKDRTFWHCGSPTENTIETLQHISSYSDTSSTNEGKPHPASPVCPQRQIPQWHSTQISPLEGFPLSLLSTAVGIFCNGLHKQFLWSKQEMYLTSTIGSATWSERTPFNETNFTLG